MVVHGMIPPRSEAQNASFLVLDLGSNTFRCGSSSASLIKLEKSRNPIADGNEDATSDSTEEESSSSGEIHKRVGKDRKDPDWVPEKKKAKSSSWSFRTAKPKPGPSIGSKPIEVSAGESMGSNPVEISGPPEYLVRLLKLRYNWRVEFDQRSGKYVYISASGISHCSLSEAFDSFLHSTSKYNETPQIVPAGIDRGKKGKKAYVTPVGPIGEPPILQHDSFREKGEGSSQNPISELNHGANSENGKTRSCAKENDGTRKEKMSASARGLDEVHEVGPQGQCLKHEDRRPDFSAMGVAGNDNRGRILGFGRSRRTSRENVGVGRKADVVIDIEDDIAVTESAVSSVAQKDDDQPPVQKGVRDEKSHFDMNGKPGRLGCSSRVLVNQTNISGTNQCSGALGAKRSLRINEKHVPVEDELDMIMGADDYFYWPEFTTDGVANEDKERTRSSFGGVDNMEDRTLASVSHSKLLKQTNGKEFDCHKLNTESSASDVAQLKKSNERKSFCEELKTQKQTQYQYSSQNEKAKKPTTGICFSSVTHKYPLSCAAKKKIVDSGNVDGKKRKRRNGGCSLNIRSNKRNEPHEQALAQIKLCILSWLIDSGTLTEYEKLVCITKNNRSDVSTGLVTRGGIRCECCEEVMPLLKFEAHAGGNFQQPFENIYLLSGKTLMQCLLEAWTKEKEKRKVGFRTVGMDPDPSDDTCGVCADGGRLICCDGCPSTFHQNCLMLKALPEGRWYCPYCSCTFCMVAGHVSDKALETLRLLTCKQCRRKYHQDCALEKGKQEMGKIPSIFCGENCVKIAGRLSEMLGTPHSIDGGFSWTLLKCHDEDEGVGSNRRLSFTMECNAKLSMALAVLNECFDPLIDQLTGVDMIYQAVYNCGSNFTRLNYEGFYTLILEKNEEVMSAASLRFHGTKLAEMPFIGTRPVFRRQGMCRRLLKAIEDILSSLYIKKLVIPAIPELLETWTTSFSFRCLQPSHKDEIKNLSMVIFPETTLLQKSIHNTRAINDVLQANESCDRGVDVRKTDEQPPSSYNDQVLWSRDGRMIRDSSRDPQTKVWDHCFSETSFQGTAEFASASSSQMSRWTQNAGETTDVHADTIRGSLAFDNYLRLSS